MADAAHGDDPSYHLRIHVRAVPELATCDEGEAIRSIVREAARRPEPTSHPKIEHLEANDLIKTRAGDARALCAFEKPVLRVLLVDDRRVVYDRLDVAVDRAADVGGESHGE